MSCELKKTLPEFGLRFPEIRLNRVVFPDPLGPIIPVIVPSLIFNEQFETAARPPKYFVRLFICKIFLSVSIQNYTLFNLFRILLRVFSVNLKNPLFLSSLTPCSFSPFGVWEFFTRRLKSFLEFNTAYSDNAKYKEVT